MGGSVQRGQTVLEPAFSILLNTAQAYLYSPFCFWLPQSENKDIKDVRQVCHHSLNNIQFSFIPAMVPIQFNVICVSTDAIPDVQSWCISSANKDF